VCVFAGMRTVVRFRRVVDKVDLAFFDAMETSVHGGTMAVV